MASTSNAKRGASVLLDDPFTLEIIKEGFLAANEEMFVAMARASMSPIIYEVLDYATGITDSDGNLIAQGNGVTLFLGTLTYGVREVLEKFGKGGLRPGDIIATNDPYKGGGTHLSDVGLFMPVFYRGELIAWCANKAHWTEVGGKDPGSWTTNSTEIYQEGLQFPCIKVFENDKPLPQVVDLIRANVRLPHMSLGDFYAQAASLRVAGRRIIELIEKYGLDTVKRGMATLQEQGRSLAVKELKRLPKGTFTAEQMMDGLVQGVGELPIRVKVTITDAELIADFTGNPPQVLGPINCTSTALRSALRLIWLAMSDPHIQPTEGFFSVLKVVCPEGTVFTARRPAPTSCYWEGMLYSADLIWKALVQAVPDRLPAAHFLSVCASITAAYHGDDGEFVLLVEPQAGGWGAAYDRDGESGVFCAGDGETYVLPVEVTEQHYGIRVERYSFNTEPGGEGKFAGGRGLVREYRILHEKGGHYTGILGRHHQTPWGVDGGRNGSGNYIQIVRADGSVTEPTGLAARLPLRQGDVLRLVTGSGGGWGDPRQRDQDLVRRDLCAGIISERTAREVYGLDI